MTRSEVEEIFNIFRVAYFKEFQTMAQVDIDLLEDTWVEIFRKDEYRDLKKVVFKVIVNNRTVPTIAHIAFELLALQWAKEEK